MTGTTEIEQYFDGKPTSLVVFRAIVEETEKHGTFDIDVKSQISFGRQRKFAWFWLYNVTRKNADGVPHLMLAIDERIDDDHIRNIERIGESRWNHQILVPSLTEARSAWLAALLGRAHAYGSG